MATAAGIVTYEPDISRLIENVGTIAPQVEELFVFDNGSSDVATIRDLLRAFPHATLYASNENLGISGALNHLAQVAEQKGYKWLVTMDQDSVAPAGMVSELQDVAEETGAALVTPYIVDRNKISVGEYLDLPLPRYDYYRQAARRGAITSGALTNMSALVGVGGFDNDLFIDYVDYDLNQRLLLANHSIIRANETYLLHEVGKAVRTWLRVPRKDVDGSWHLERFFSFGHSPQRCYYKARNRVIFTRKYGRRIGITHEGVWQLPQQIALTLLFESERRTKLSSFWRGIRAGASAEVQKY
jgi:rhamnosyltransferase